MKKKILKKLREACNELIGEEETNKIIAKSIEEVLEQTKPLKKSKRGTKQ
jgi:hypothetical protein